MSTIQNEALERSIFIMKNLSVLNFDKLLQTVEQIATQCDKEEWHAAAVRLGIGVDALRILDSANPPIPYPYYFCTPEILREHPELITYYRNVAMVSQKAMNDMGLNTTGYEAGLVPPPDIAQDLTHYFNKVASGVLAEAGQVTPQRHLEMAYTNLGDSLGGAWQCGRLDRAG